MRDRHRGCAVVYGIVTLVEGTAGAQVRELWQEIAATLGADAIAEMTHPHLTYHCADDYDFEGLRASLEQVAASTAPFEARAPGVNLLARPGGGVTALGVVRTPALERLHEALWRPCSEAARGDIYERYAAASWWPHVTLSYSPRVHDAAHLLVAAMREQRLPSTLAVDNLAVIRDTGGEGHVLEFRVPLQGAPGHTSP